MHSHANRSYWLAALLFGGLFVLLILIMSWLLRTITPIDLSMKVATVEGPLPPSLPPLLDPTPTLKASLLDAKADTERLAAQLAALSDDLKHKAEQCKPAEPPPLPADRWSSKDLSVLQGCWYLGREAPAVRGDIGARDRENCTSKVGRICFDAGGHGRHEQTISCPRAGDIFCSAPVVGQFSVDGTFRTTQPAVNCQSGTHTKWLSGTLSCRRVDDNHAICRTGGQYELGLPAQDLDFRRSP
jgi:hypothetical protein